MAAPQNLQEAIEKAGSPVKHLWKTDVQPWNPPVVEPEIVGWQKEQIASFDTVSLADLSFHMRDVVISGPDATRLLAEHSVNNYEKFDVGRAKQFVPVTANGDMVADGILLRESKDRYVLSGNSTTHSWVLFHGEKGGYKVDFVDSPNAAFNKEDPLYFRFQIQGPLALDLVSKVFGGPLPETKFFHSTEAMLDGRRFRALRHGMVGQAGYEFIGDFRDYDYVKDAFLTAGEEFGIVPVGSMAYATNTVESGWIPTPLAGIYTDPALRDYREWLSVFTYEGLYPLHGSYFSADIEDYYTSPIELGYGRFIHFDHDFEGRDALTKAKDDESLRTRMTLVVDPDEAKEVLGDPVPYFVSQGIHRVEADGKLAGTVWSASQQIKRDTVLALALMAPEHAEPGTEVEFVCGDHPGFGTAPEADVGLPRLKATVQPSPYDAFARNEYRKPM